MPLITYQDRKAAHCFYMILLGSLWQSILSLQMPRFEFMHYLLLYVTCFIIYCTCTSILLIPELSCF